MDIDDISPELRDEYNSKYKRAFDLLSKYAFIGGRGRIGNRERKHIEETIPLFTRCIEIWRGSWSAMWGLGKAHQALGHHRTALGWFERALKIEEGNSDVFREASLEALSLGEAEKALSYAKKACDLAPDNTGLHANLALALLLNKQEEEALKKIQETCERDPKDTVSKNVMALISDVLDGKRPYPEKIEG